MLFTFYNKTNCFVIFYRIYFGESSHFKDDDDFNLKSSNPRLLEYEQAKNRLIVIVCDVYLDDPKVSEIF